MALLDKLFTVGEAAELLHLSTGRIGQLCIQHSIGTKAGRDRFLTSDEIDALRHKQRPVGRPPLAPKENSNT